MHAPVRAFRNPEYRRRCRIHIYAASLGDNSAIMRRARARPGRHTALVPLFLSLYLFAYLSVSLSLSLFVPLFPTLLLYLSLCVCVRLIADVYSEFESM